ncbi:MAG: hypothetical protein AAGA09_04880 [Pseudomonadota bacterium]
MTVITRVMDKVFVQTGIDEKEFRVLKHRNYLYCGMLFALLGVALLIDFALNIT